MKLFESKGDIVFSNLCIQSPTGRYPAIPGREEHSARYHRGQRSQLRLDDPYQNQGSSSASKRDSWRASSAISSQGHFIV